MLYQAGHHRDGVPSLRTHNDAKLMLLIRLCAVNELSDAPAEMYALNESCFFELIFSALINGSVGVGLGTSAHTPKSPDSSALIT